MITGFRHRGLRRFFEKGDAKALQPEQVARIRRLLARLNAANALQDLAAPGHRLHPLKGQRQGVWAIDVSRNWRLTFRFDGKNCFDVDYEDYH